MPKTNWFGNQVINTMRGTNLTAPAAMYLGLFTTIPTVAYVGATPTGVEVSGGAYARTSVAFAAPAGNPSATSNSAAVTFPTATASWGTVTGWGLLDGTAGTANLWYFGYLIGGTVANPATAPTVAVTGGGSTGGGLQAGAYTCSYTWKTANGETQESPASTSFTVAAGNIPQITIPALPLNVISYNVYLTVAGGTARYLYMVDQTGTTANLSVATIANLTSEPAPPSVNTATYNLSQVVSQNSTFSVAAGALTLNES